MYEKGVRIVRHVQNGVKLVFGHNCEPCPNSFDFGHLLEARKRPMSPSERPALNSALPAAQRLLEPFARLGGASPHYHAGAHLRAAAPQWFPGRPRISPGFLRPSGPFPHPSADHESSRMPSRVPRVRRHLWALLCALGGQLPDTQGRTQSLPVAALLLPATLSPVPPGILGRPPG